MPVEAFCTFAGFSRSSYQSPTEAYKGKISSKTDGMKYDFLWGKTVSFTNNGKQLCWSVWSDKNWIYPAEDASVAKEWSEDIDKTDLLHMLQTIC